MTAPTITYGHGYLTDCDDATGWGENLNNMLGADATLTVQHKDIFQIQADFDDGAGTDEYCYYEKDITNISSNTYPKYLIRWKTSAGSAGAQAKVVLVFTAGTQEIELGYNTTWAVASGDTTSGKTIDKVRFYADDELDVTPNGTYYVYYDFLLLHRGTFTFPFVDGRVFLKPSKKNVELDIPFRDTGILQQFGMKSPQILLEGTMNTNRNWGTPDGEYLYYILRNPDPWQWFTNDLINCKVVVDNEGFSLGYDKNVAAQRVWSLPLKLYSLSSLAESTWDDKQWFGQ